MPRRRRRCRRVSNFFVTVSTNTRHSNDLSRRLAAAVAEMNDAQVVQRDILDYLEPLHSSRVGVEGFEGQEVGGRRHYLHAHFSWRVVHGGRLVIGPADDPEQLGINRRLQRFFRERLATGRNVYVHCTLNRELSALENYQLKQQNGRCDSDGDAESEEEEGGSQEGSDDDDDAQGPAGRILEDVDIDFLAYHR